jgi:transcriptional regulator of acetoin/glycerol metabolism
MSSHCAESLYASDSPLTSADLYALRDRFAADPVNTDLSTLRPVIARSWRRSVDWEVSPAMRSFTKIRQPRVDELFLQQVAPVVEELTRIAADTGATIYLADQDGTITGVHGDPEVLRKVERLVVPGVAMAEDVAGTNSDGTSLEEGGAVQVWGAEHFCEGMQHLCCTSVPIYDPLRRSVRAVLSLSIPERLARMSDARAMALVAHGAAKQMSQLLASRLASREQALLSAYLTEVRKRGSESVVVTDGKTTIASREALNTLGDREYSVLAGYAHEAEHLGAPVERELVVGAGTVMRAHVRPITSAGETVGSLIRLRPAAADRQARRPVPSAGRTDPFCGELVGQSPALRRALEVASTATRRQLSAYILGEPGTGKWTLARAMAAALADNVLTVDCAAEGLSGRIAEWQCGITGDTAIALRHVDALSGQERADLMEFLTGQDRPPVILTMRRLSDHTMDVTNVLGGVEIDMPPLRNRREDIPLLVEHFLSSADCGVTRVSSSLLRALTEADWSGNVAELRQFVEAAAKRCGFAELGFPHLSEAQRSALTRSPLSRIEEAELQQIREALAEAGGNRVSAAELLQIGRSTLYRKIEMYTRRGYNFE